METEKVLRLSDFDYELPKELIAQEPVLDRTRARLLILDKKTGAIHHKTFADIADYFESGDVLVLNDTKVIKARLFGSKPTGGRVEVLLHKQLNPREWEVLLKPGGRVREGTMISFGQNGHSLHAEVLNSPEQDSGLRRIRFEAAEDLSERLDSLGHIPLPPYIDRPDTDMDRELYQTVFAKNKGAVASPTAGLHFDERLLGALREKGVEILFITLHVGYGTFQPVAVDEIKDHHMHAEEYEITNEAASRLTQALDQGRRITVCGTTAVRALEPRARKTSEGKILIDAGRGETDLFISPPHEFLATHRLITNFHLPRTTLLMMVSALTGREVLFRAYAEAVKERYRFYSYGDAMFIL